MSGRSRYLDTATIHLINGTTDGLGAARRDKTICHEMGHVLGLAHRDSRDTCMYTYGAAGVPAYPDAHDIDEVDSRY